MRPQIELSCEFHYEAAHFLPKVPEGHQCARIHGHSYHLTVVVVGSVRDDGFVVDFSEVKSAVKKVVDQLDHQFLNTVEGLWNPTVENQLVWLWDKLFLMLPLESLKLQETATSSATFRGYVA
jgi:6-pyruvoyltetrahydropterin/6-carboxytetrahydropterin synthase